MNKKFRQEAVTLIQLLLRLVNFDLRNDADGQRYLEVWKDKMAPSLLVLSVFLGRWIPAILIAEEKVNGFVQQWIGDGNQRCAYLLKFRFQNMRLNKNIPGGNVPYYTVERDENGRPVIDENDNVVRVLKTFDISNHTYEELPDELKTAFDNYTMSLVVYEDCTKEDIGEILRIYNNSSSMTKEQQALTNIENFAGRIKEIENSGLINNIYSLSSKKSGKSQRMVMEVISNIFHRDNWKSNAISMAQYLNEHSSDAEFDAVKDANERLYNIIEKEEHEEMFVSKGGPHKNAAIMFTAFYEFTKFGRYDEEFLEFLDAFVSELQYKKNEGINYNGMENISFTDVDVSYCSEKKADYNTSGGSKKSGNVAIRREIILNLLHEYFKEEVIDPEEENAVVEEEKKENNIPLMSIENSGIIVQAGLQADTEEILNGCMDICKTFVDYNTTENDIIGYFEKLDDLTEDIEFNDDFFTIWNIIAVIGLIASKLNVEDWLADYVKAYTYKEESYFDAYNTMNDSIGIMKNAA